MSRDAWLTAPTDPDWQPPHCPNPHCPHHHDPADWRWQRDGTFPRADGRRIQRFLCRQCGRSFSTQTFHVTYWMKRPELLPEVFRRQLECSCFRQSARGLGAAHSTILDQTLRLGRHCLLFQRLHGPRGNPAEEIVIDGLASYETSKSWPCDFNIAVGRSHFLYAFTDAELRRSGSMTAAQKRMRALHEQAHGRPHRRATEREVAELLRLVAPEPGTLRLVSDEHAAYPRAVRALEHLEVEHHTVSSRQARTPRNPLFPVNLADLLLRHCGSHHKRKTIAFPRRRHTTAVRLAIFQAWRNFMKGVSERDPRSPTPAMRLGLRRSRLTLEQVLEKRLFPSRVRLPPRLRLYYEGRVPTRSLPRCRTHELRYAC